MQICTVCGAVIPAVIVLAGVRLDLRGRKRCLACRPHRPLTRPRKPVVRAVLQKGCDSCGEPFPGRQVIAGRLRYLYRRRFCLRCSPFGMHNTSKVAPGPIPEAERIEYRRRKRNAKTYRSLKRRRLSRKLQLIAERGGRCQECGYATCTSALEFHHRERATKLFEVGRFNGSLARLRAEAEKCDLLCANCHRRRHATEDRVLLRAGAARERRAIKQRAVQHMGSACSGCDQRADLSLFEFHHRDASSKDFGISEDGIVRNWGAIVAELAKCVMLCANCHREVHAGVRELDEGLLGLAEDALPYAA